jgi:hypothetical protein
MIHDIDSVSSNFGYGYVPGAPNIATRIKNNRSRSVDQRREKSHILFILLGPHEQHWRYERDGEEHHRTYGRNRRRKGG